MRPVRVHRPGPPADPDPPGRLLEIADRLEDPLISQAGVTTTEDGRWALYVTVPEDATVPIPHVEAQAEAFPVVYEAAAKEPPRAGPAFPARERGARPRSKPPER